MAKTARQKTLTFGKRLFVVVLILAGIFVGILELAERSKEPLRLGLQDYLTQVSGHPAEITVLEKSELFPDIDFVLKGIVIRDKDDSNKTLVTVDRAAVSMSFWKRFVGRADYKTLSLENAAFATGYLLPRKLEIFFAGIADPKAEAGNPHFILEGAYDGRDVLLTAAMQRHGEKDSSYDFPGRFPVTFKIGETEAAGVFHRGLVESGFETLEIKSGGQTVVFSIPDIRTDESAIPLTGKIGDGAFQGHLKPAEGGFVLAFDASGLNVLQQTQLQEFARGVRQDLAFGDENIFRIEIQQENKEQQI